MRTREGKDGCRCPPMLVWVPPGETAPIDYQDDCPVHGDGMRRLAKAWGETDAWRARPKACPARDCDCEACRAIRADAANATLDYADIAKVTS